MLVVSYCAGFLPLPLSKPPGKDGRPFPCQNRPCGCQSAAQCWKSCCCFNNAQKLAWAKANGVTPPAFVIAAARQEQRKSCCAKTKASCCSAAKSSCCSTTKVCQKDDGKPGKQSDASTKNAPRQIVIGSYADRCKGGGSAICSIPVAIVSFATRKRFTAPQSRWCKPTSVVAAGRGSEPPEPPPRLAG